LILQAVEQNFCHLRFGAKDDLHSRHFNTRSGGAVTFEQAFVLDVVSRVINGLEHQTRFDVIADGTRSHQITRHIAGGVNKRLNMLNMNAFLNLPCASVFGFEYWNETPKTKPVLTCDKLFLEKSAIAIPDVAGNGHSLPPVRFGGRASAATREFSRDDKSFLLAELTHLGMQGNRTVQKFPHGPNNNAFLRISKPILRIK
jgi:hypothetical protein